MVGGRRTGKILESSTTFDDVIINFLKNVVKRLRRTLLSLFTGKKC